MKFSKLFLCFALLASGTVAVNAQGLSGLIKKGKEAVKKGEKAVGKILGSEESSSPESESVSTESLWVSPSGIAVSNPANAFVEIEPVGLFGVSKSENYGDAYLVLKVKNKTTKDVTRFGSSVQNQKMIAVDNNGKVYNIDASGTIGYDTPEGLVIRIVLDEPALMFTDINKNVNMMQQVKFGVFSDAYHQGNVTLSNVPIYWDIVPE